jgi:hypothetical protein
MRAQLSIQLLIQKFCIVVGLILLPTLSILEARAATITIPAFGSQLPLELNGGAEGNISRASWIECFNNGNCANHSASTLSIYPASGVDGQLLGGCYTRNGQNLIRSGNLQFSGSSVTCPTTVTAPQLRVLIFARQECPAGVTLPCTTGGRVLIGCSIDNLSPVGPNNPFTFTTIPCFSGRPIIRDALGGIGGGGNTTIVNNPPAAGCTAAQIQVSNINEPTTGMSNGSFVVSYPSTVTNGALSITPATGTVTGTGNSRTFNGLNANGYTVTLNYTQTGVGNCSNTAQVTLANEPCGLGQGFSGSSCVPCAIGWYKSTVGNQACTQCPSVTIANASSTTVTTSTQGSTSLSDCRATPNCNVGYSQQLVGNSGLCLAGTPVPSPSPSSSCPWNLSMENRVPSHFPTSGSTKYYPTFFSVKVTPSTSPTPLPTPFSYQFISGNFATAGHIFGQDVGVVKVASDTTGTSYSDYIGGGMSTSPGGTLGGGGLPAADGSRRIHVWNANGSGSYSIRFQDNNGCQKTIDIAPEVSPHNCSQFTCSAGRSLLLLDVWDYNSYFEYSGPVNGAFGQILPTNPDPYAAMPLDVRGVGFKWSFMQNYNPDFLNATDSTSMVFVAPNPLQPGLCTLGTTPVVRAYYPTNFLPASPPYNLAGGSYPAVGGIGDDQHSNRCVVSQAGKDKVVLRACVPNQCGTTINTAMPANIRLKTCTFGGTTYYAPATSTCP